MNTGARLRSLAGGFAPAGSWFAPADGVDHRVLDRAVGPVLDVGCGPGRHAVALAERGVPTLGIDISPLALAEARRRGAVALHRSVFDRVPAAGRWRTALLLDGNIGIGGSPLTLLRRLHDVLAPRGACLVETQPPDCAPSTTLVRLELGAAAGPWFPLAIVSARALPEIAARAGFVTGEQWHDANRWFALLGRA